MKSKYLFIAILFFAPACNGQQASTGSLPAIAIKAELVVDGLQAPTDITFPGNGSIWLTEQKGKIKIIKGGKVTGLLLDLGGKLVDISNGYDERGLLGIALHPAFATNKNFMFFTARLAMAVTTTPAYWRNIHCCPTQKKPMLPVQG